jgi:hypothetical protein
MSNEKPVQGTEAKDAERARSRRMKALIIGTIAAGGAFQLNGWQAQANGNRSSGKTAAIRGILAEGTTVQTGTPTTEAMQLTPNSAMPK